ncbi:MAG TPA: tripartite tricarboxylate transporter substrate binding protein [Burkholderiales bacterium]|jgi:tripartite-type tricarboxylate transporter receptor subunit TctC
MTSSHRRTLLKFGAASVLPALLPASPRAFAQAGDYPHKPVVMIIPYTAGGGVDTLVRLMLPWLNAELKQTVLPENRPGVSGIVGAQYVSHAAPDGYTLLAGNLTTNVMNGLLLKNPGYNPQRDFEPLALVNSFPMVLVVNPKSRFNSVTDVIKAAKADPDGLTFGSSGIGSAQHLAASLFQDATKTRMRHIPYKGGNGTMTDLIGGQLDMAFEVAPVAGPFVRDNRLRALGLTSTRGIAALPGVKPIAQLGVPGYEMVFWNAFFAPKGTPQPIVDKLATVITKVVAMREFEDKMNDMGAIPGGAKGAEFAAFQKAEVAKWSRLVKAMDIKPE